MIETTEDGFLDGRLMIRQPRHGYRAGMDPVLLAAAVTARSGERVLELGCGVGVALFCLMHRVPQLTATGVELQADLAALADQNGTSNGFEARIVASDIGALPDEVRGESFDHVLMNPPFFDRAGGTSAEDPGREAGRGEALALDRWLDTGVRRLAHGGALWVIQRAERLPDVLTGLDPRVGDIRALPLSARAGRTPETVIVSAKKGARGPFRLLMPVVLHDGDAHVDGDRHSALARAVLRDGAALEMKC